MSENLSESYYTDRVEEKPEKKNLLLHITLFIVTLCTTTLAGMQWTTGTMGPYRLQNLLTGLPYSVSILFVLAVHEFGHYFAARYHNVKATLPYFIPIPSLSGMFLNFGTMGAVIRTKSAIPDNKAMFDIGVAGPIAGFIASLMVLIYGFTHLPGPEYILAIHPDYFTPEYGKSGLSLIFGDTFLFSALRHLFTAKAQFVPPMSEIYHYPYLCVGWFGLFVTSMNMIPVGQLDGGHIIYSMFGIRKHEIIAKVSMAVLLILGIAGIATSLLEMPVQIGWSGWLFWAIILLLVIKVKHPPVTEYEKLDTKRMLLGYISIFILFLSFSPAPFVLILSA
ncbi:MAG: site-2 protease family protein [Syntrophothermus sp.]